MKNILKYAVVLLLLFAMVGTASATVSGVQATVDNNDTNPNNYDVVVTWAGALTDPVIDVFTVTIDGESFSGTTNDTTYTFSNIVLTAGNPYTATVEDDTGSSVPFTPAAAPQDVAPPVISNFKSDTVEGSTDFTLSWTWDLFGNADGKTLELWNGSEWNDVSAVDSGTSVSTTLAGSATADKEIIVRVKQGALTSSNVTVATIKGLDITSSKGSNSITWSGITGWDHYEFNVSDGSTNLTGLSINNGEITATNLDSSKTYTLTIRGINIDDSIHGLFATKAETPGTTAFVDSIVTTPERTIYDASTSETKPFSIENATTFTLNVTSTIPSTFNWTITFDDDGTPADVTSAQSENKTNETDNLSNELKWKPSKAGKYSLTLEIADKDTPSNKQTLSWSDVTVTERSTGSRIWQEGMPTDYTWDARSFSGFYYNLDTGEGNESMTMKGIGRSIDKGNLTYTTTTSSTDYEYSPWGSYEIVGFMGDKYFAGDNNSSLMKNGNLSKVLMDTDDKVQLRAGVNYALEEGYSVTVQQIDVNGGKAQILFYKDGKELGSTIANEGQDAAYYKDVGSGNGKNTTFVKTRVKSVFQGTESSIVELEGFFQISENLTRLESGTSIGKMKINSVSSDKIEMENDERISLSQDTEVDLMGKVKLQVADSSTLRFAPIIVYSEPGTYEIRGTVSDYNTPDYIIYEWDPRNFEGFYYDINDDIESSEKIFINQTLDNGSRSIDKGNLEYTSKITTVDYNYSAWDNYSVIGFMGEKYYAGDEGSLLKEGNLSKVLVDSDDRRQMRTGESLVLEEGISIKIDQIDTDGNKARLIIEQDGREINSSIVNSGGDYIYEGNNSKIKNTSFIRIHVDSVFQGTESSIVSISGVFQASLNMTKLESDTKYGKMKVDSYSSSGINLSNDERITLSQDNDVEFMKVGNDTMYFKVGDNSTLRFAPVVERQIGSTDPLEVKLDPQNTTVGDSVKITVNDRGLVIEGVTVYVNGSKVGTTNSDGTLNYTTDKVGSFRVTAEKSGFVNGSATLNVAEKLINMTVRVSPETVYFGTAGTIKATDSLNGSAIGDATVYISGESIGRTNSSGELNYTFNKTGNVTIDVVKEKYNNGTTTINVSQEVAFAYANFTLKPDEPSAKKAIKLTFDVTNNGIKNGSHEVSLVLKDSSGNVIDQDNKSVSVDMGKSKSVSLSVKAPEEGTYTLTLQETDSNRTIDLPSSMSTVPVGAAKFGSTLLYIVLAIVAILVIAVVGFVAYLFGVKGATKDNYQMVAQDVIDDIKSKFQRK